VRQVAWLALSVLVLVAVAAVVVLQRPVRAAEVQRQHTLVSAGLVLFPLLAGGAGFAAALSYRPKDRERAVWTSLGAACVLWGTGRAVFWYEQAVGQAPSFPSAAELLTAGFFVLGLWAVYQEYRAVRELVGPAQRAAIVAVVLATLVAGYALFLRPVVTAAPWGLKEGTSLALSVAGLAMIPLATAPVLAFLGGLEGYVWGLISASLICISVAVMWYSNAVFFDTWFAGHRSNLLQMVGFALLAMGSFWHRALMREG